MATLHQTIQKPICRKMTSNEQLILWVRGQSIHNGTDASNGECCPDFSCCIPSLAWDYPDRLAFLVGDDETREHLLCNSIDGIDVNETLSETPALPPVYQYESPQAPLPPLHFNCDCRIRMEKRPKNLVLRLLDCLANYLRKKKDK